MAAYQNNRQEFQPFLTSFLDVLQLDEQYWQTLADRETALAGIEELTGLSLREEGDEASENLSQAFLLALVGNIVFSRHSSPACGFTYRASACERLREPNQTGLQPQDSTRKLQRFSASPRRHRLSRCKFRRSGCKASASKPAKCSRRS